MCESYVSSFRRPFSGEFGILSIVPEKEVTPGSYLSFVGVLVTLSYRTRQLVKDIMVFYCLFVYGHSGDG